MRTPRLLGYGLLGVIVLGAVLLGIVVWRSFVPSASARVLSAVYDERPRAADAENSYLYLWGFTAPDGTDPVELAQRRVSWALAKIATPNSNTPDPFPGEQNWMTQARSPAMKRLVKDCVDGAATPCAAAFAEWPLKAGFSALENLQATRYAAMLQRPHWFESVPYQISLPLPAFGDAIDGQRVWLLQVRAAAVAGDAARVKDLLERDFNFWREVLRSSDVLISKVMGSVGIRNNLFFGNLAMRELPPAQRAAAIPAAWRQPFTTGELSSLRPMAGEFQWVTSYFWTQDPEAMSEYDEDVAFDEGYSPTHNWIEKITRRFRPPQRQLNQLADYYLRAVRAYEVPLDRYSAARKVVRDSGRKLAIAVDVSAFALRISTVEGMRRAALLTAELRGRGLSVEQVAGALAVNPAKNPFTLQSFEWDPTQRAVIYNGPEDDRRRRHTYFF